MKRGTRVVFNLIMNVRSFTSHWVEGGLCLPDAFVCVPPSVLTLVHLFPVGSRCSGLVEGCHDWWDILYRQVCVCVCVCVCVRSALYSSESNIRNDMLSVSGHSLLFPVQITAQVGSSGQFH